MSDPRLFYVTGMHRSGTSALTRVINLLGASVGVAEDLMPPQADNPTGFWELRAVARLNEEILTSHGGSWRSRPSKSIAQSMAGPDARNENWAGRMAAIVDRLRQSGPGPYVLKDPRFAWTLPLWESVATPDVVIVALRAPEHVCGSLNRRNAIKWEDAAALWLGYVREAMSTKHPRLVVDYKHLVGTPDDTVTAIAASLRLPEPSPSTLRHVRAFMDPMLDHAKLAVGDLRGNNLKEARRLYERISRESA